MQSQSSHSNGYIYPDPDLVQQLSSYVLSQFQLGDFGLYNPIGVATSVGTTLYKASEIVLEGDQTHKGDVWSLFVNDVVDIGCRRVSLEVESI
jgi:hypothetical protein